jgi:hypothetical protein
VDVDRYPASAKQVKGVGAFALGAEQAARRKGDVSRTTHDQFERFFADARHKGVALDEFPHARRHDALRAIGNSTRTPSLTAMAATSSVMSIPTGHQTMHRPQPTQPVESN